MSHYGLKINKTESPDKTPYTVYYPHTIGISNRNWSQPYIQIVSIDPATKNYALRVEQRHHNGKITTIFFDKVSLSSFEEKDGVIIQHTYEFLTNFLNRCKDIFFNCHYIIIERQLPQNYKATRIAQHTLTYFSLLLHNAPLLPQIFEIDPKIKGRQLNAPKNISDKQLKSWAVTTARDLLTQRGDSFALSILEKYRNKQDDLSDTVCQIEGLFKLWGMELTEAAVSRYNSTPRIVINTRHF